MGDRVTVTVTAGLGRGGTVTVLTGVGAVTTATRLPGDPGVPVDGGTAPDWEDAPGKGERPERLPEGRGRGLPAGGEPGGVVGATVTRTVFVGEGTTSRD